MSRRMGRSKALLPFGGAPIIVRVVETLAAAGGIAPIVVVTGHEGDRVISALAGRDVLPVHNPDYESGEMLSSVQAGVRAVAGRAHAGRADAVVLSLVDQPGVLPATVRSLVDAWRQTAAPIVSPLHAGRGGHPVVIAARLFDEILALVPGDSLQTLMRRHDAVRLRLPVADPAVLADIDTPADYQQALRLRPG
jgi:molybdenum cofactor cytidylyltransferase